MPMVGTVAFRGTTAVCSARLLPVCLGTSSFMAAALDRAAAAVAFFVFGGPFGFVALGAAGCFGAARFFPFGAGDFDAGSERPPGVVFLFRFEDEDVSDCAAARLGMLVGTGPIRAADRCWV